MIWRCASDSVRIHVSFLLFLTGYSYLGSKPKAWGASWDLPAFMGPRFQFCTLSCWWFESSDQLLAFYMPLLFRRNVAPNARIIFLKSSSSPGSWLCLILYFLGNSLMPLNRCSFYILFICSIFFFLNRNIELNPSSLSLEWKSS